MTFLDKGQIRLAILNTLPDIDSGSVFNKDRIYFTYVPSSHAHALDPEATLVEGIRGAGKSFWCSALKDETARHYISEAFPNTQIKRNLIVKIGFDTNNTSKEHPSTDVIKKLLLLVDSRTIWKTVIAHNLDIRDPFPYQDKTWESRCRWVQDHPEEYDQLIAAIDQQAKKNNQLYLILFDALERVANDWGSIRPLVRDLFQLALDFRGYSSIRLKLFVRPDMLQDKTILQFPDASKLIARKSSLQWFKADLYALFFQCIGNDLNYGEAFRKYVASQYKLNWESVQSGWRLPSLCCTDEETQKNIFHQITGPRMSLGVKSKKGIPYIWLPNRLQDGLQQVSPRTFCLALRMAASDEKSNSNWNYPLYFDGLNKGVQNASKIRVDELNEEYPWLQQVMNPLSKLKVPCEPQDFISRWQETKILDSLVNNMPDKLPPINLVNDNNEAGLLKDLKGLNLISYLSDGRVQMPDVYRIAFGLGRHGGVKPLR